MKVCTSCNISKDSSLFYNGRNKCKECTKACSRQYTIDNKEKIANDKKRYYFENKEDILNKKKLYNFNNRDKIIEKNRIYYLNNKEKLNKYNREYSKSHRLELNDYAKNKKKTDLNFKLSMILRNRTRNFLKSKGLKKTVKFQEYIGCSLDELKKHLEKQFQIGMSWDNYSYKGWHVDHIIPLSSAKSEEELYKLCHYTNLQPLWAKDNFKKGSQNGN